ncbi:MAG: outer membrane beta-barrel protein [Deltaproteobacteria bacterium]
MRSRKLKLPLMALLPALSAALLVFGTPQTAKALPLVTLSGSARGLYGSPTDDLRINPYGAGLGLRLGVTLPAALYLGGSFAYFFGESEQAVLGLEQSRSVLQVMAHVGYDLGFGPVTLRPQLGLGLAQAHSEVGDLSDSESDFALAPGAEFIFGFGLLSISAEAGYDVVFAGADDAGASAWILGLGLGFSI